MSIIPAKSGFTFGCDPELFVKNPEGVYVSAAGLIPGTKQEPYPVDLGAVQVDGMAAEFNITPVDNYEDWEKNITTVLAQLQTFLPEGYTLDPVPAVTFDPLIFENAPEEAKELGCMPDSDAWTGERNNPPECLEQPYLRTASGHLHIGWTKGTALDDFQHVMNCRDLVKQFDWFLGAWSVLKDPDPTRRLLYGKAGAHRIKPYGVEYRVLSNFWLTSEELRLDVWNRMQAGISAMANAFFPTSASGYNQRLIDSINESHVDEGLFSRFVYPILEPVHKSRSKPLPKTSDYWTTAVPTPQLFHTTHSNV